MSYMYKYKFISPETLFAIVREEMKSYFDTQALDDVMFPIWTGKCLRKLGKSSLKIDECVLFVDGYEAKLPPDFHSVREAWLTGHIAGPVFKLPGAYYKQITTVLNKPYDACNAEVNCDPCNPDIVTVVTKTTGESQQTFRLSHLLKPGTTRVKNFMESGCINYGSTSDDTFDIGDGKFYTDFSSGEVYLMYYSNQTDESGYQLIPDNYRVQEYIEAFIKQKLYEQLANQATDETFNQIQGKYQYYKQLADEAYILADIEVKKPDVHQLANSIRKDNHRLDPYYNSIYGKYRRR